MVRTSNDIIEVFSIAIFASAGLAMLYYAYSGMIVFGTGILEVWNKRIFIFLAVALISLSYALVFNQKTKQIKYFFGMFAILIVVFMVFGAGLGILSASEEGNGFNPATSLFIAMDINTSATADIGIGLNSKLIADSIANIVPTIVLVVIIFQMLYAGEADEFIKAFIEGIACVLFLLIYNFVGGVPL